MCCSSCGTKHLPCVPTPDEAVHRRRSFAKRAKEDIDVLCPVHQYTINLFTRQMKDMFMSSVVVSSLGKYLDKHLKPYRNVYSETSIKTYCHAYQEVSVIHGVLTRVDHANMHDVWGFELDLRDKRDRVCAISPHFGLCSPVLAYSLVDNALQCPGEVYTVDACVLTRSWVATHARIMIVAGVMSATHIRILVGWRFA